VLVSYVAMVPLSPAHPDLSDMPDGWLKPMSSAKNTTKLGLAALAVSEGSARARRGSFIAQRPAASGRIAYVYLTAFF
jgi:hypothetical protein